VSRRTALSLALLTALPALAAPSLASAAVPAHALRSAAPAAYTMKALKITTMVASKSALPQKCVVDADLYTPKGVSPARPAPAILTTNGFGGSKADQAGLGRAYAAKGYVVLSYSGLGFGSDAMTSGSGSGCKITLDDREHDGAAARQLIDFLGGIKKADDGTKVDYVTKDTVAHDGRTHPGDVRVGMVGGSYGGEIQFATAAVDPRLDTIIPLITWNDLAYSLAPNNTSLPSSTSVTYATPGTEKFDWTSLFFTVGFVDGIMAAFAQSDPTRLLPCDNFADQACKSKLFLDGFGYPDQATLDFARSASVETYIKRVRIPTLLGQGQADTLFNLHEATATYTSLNKQGTPVKMIWQQWGHSHAPLPGEFDLSHPDTNYEGQVVTAWFDHYLKDNPAAPALDFTWFRDYVPYTGNAAPAFTSAPSYPLPGTTTLYGSGSSLVPTSKGLKDGSTQLGVPAQVPLSYTETSALDQSQPVTDAPGATATLSSAPLAHDVDVVGIPTATLRLASPTAMAAQGGGAGGQLVGFIKLYDVAPDGSIDLPHRVISPIRIADISKPVQVSLPGLVHRFRKGHTMKLVVSLSDAAYKNNDLAQLVTLSTSQKAPTTLTLPGKLSVTAAAAPPRVAAVRPAAGAGAGAPAAAPVSSAAELPRTGGSARLPALALALLGGAAWVRRRRTA